MYGEREEKKRHNILRNKISDYNLEHGANRPPYSVLLLVKVD